MKRAIWRVFWAFGRGLGGIFVGCASLSVIVAFVYCMELIN
jgi:hypothetical protein